MNGGASSDASAALDRLAALVDDLRTRNAQLEEALSSRVVIEQAKGVLAERYRIDVERAFDVLRGAARTSRVRIHDLAAQVVSSPRTPTAIELQLVQGRRVKGPFPAPPSGAVH